MSCLDASGFWVCWEQVRHWWVWLWAALCLGYPDHMVFSEFRRRFDVLAPHLTKKHGRNYIVVDERRVGLGPRAPSDLHPSAQTLLSSCPSFPRDSLAGPCSGSWF